MHRSASENLKNLLVSKEQLHKIVRGILDSGKTQLQKTIKEGTENKMDSVKIDIYG